MRQEPWIQKRCPYTMPPVVISRVLASLSLALLIHEGEIARIPAHPTGIAVTLPTACSAEAGTHFMNDNQMEVYFGTRTLSAVHRHLVSTAEVPLLMQHIMENREVKDLWIAADTRLTYGEVLRDLAALRAVNGDLTFRLYDPGTAYHFASPPMGSPSSDGELVCTPLEWSQSYMQELSAALSR